MCDTDFGALARGTINEILMSFMPHKQCLFNFNSWKDLSDGLKDAKRRYDSMCRHMVNFIPSQRHYGIACAFINTVDNCDTIFRMTIVGCNGNLIQDNYLNPFSPVIDYRTEEHGMDWQDLELAADWGALQDINVIREDLHRASMHNGLQYVAPNLYQERHITGRGERPDLVDYSHFCLLQDKLLELFSDDPLDTTERSRASLLAFFVLRATEGMNSVFTDPLVVCYQGTLFDYQEESQVDEYRLAQHKDLHKL